jgi:hypothetical protein
MMNYAGRFMDVKHLTEEVLVQFCDRVGMYVEGFIYNSSYVDTTNTSELGIVCMLQKE